MRLSPSALVSIVLISGCAFAPSADAPDAENGWPEDDPATYEAVHGASSALSQPGSWVPGAVGGNVRYDDAPAWQGGRNCTGSFTAGARQLKTYLQGAYPQIGSIGGYSCRQNTADASKTSVHGTGRALDIMIRTDGGKADNDKGDPIGTWLIQHATELGVQYIIWDRTSYNSSRSGTKYRGYTGPNPHVDHLHVELNLAGAGQRTPWYGAPTAPERPAAETHVSMDGDGSTFVSATIPTRQRVAPGAHVQQTWRLRNTGTTTWTDPRYGLARTSGPDFAGPNSIGLPPSTSVAPGGTASFAFDATAPTEPGVYTARFRMAAGDVGTNAFGARVYLELEVRPTADRGCRSATLGRDVPANSCVQVAYAGCGQDTCGWYQCTNGAWSCASRAGCGDDTSFANAACNTCVNTGHVCRETSDCCGADTNSAIQCLAGFCSDTSMCGVPARDCSSRTDCCQGLACSPASAGGATQCCLRGGDRCATSADCCGDMTCDANRCTARTRGQSCAATQDCGGSSYCEGGVCR